MPTYPNMGLILPEVSVTLGPIWAQMLNTAANVTDNHDHSPGKGVKIKPSGLNINSDLTFGGNNATNLNSVEFLSTLISTLTSICSIYSFGGDLYYNNGGGTPVQITSGASVNSSTSTITRAFESTTIVANTTILPGDTFSFLNIRTSLGSIVLTLPLAASVAAGRMYEFKDVDGLAQTNPTTITPSGADTIDLVAASLVLDQQNFSQRLVSDGVSKWVLQNFTTSVATPVTDRALLRYLGTSARTVGESLAVVDDAGVLSGITDTTSTVSNAFWARYTRSVASTVGVRGVARSGSSGSFVTGSGSEVNVTNMSVTITGSGRPIVVFVTPNVNSLGYIGARGDNTANTATGWFRLYRDGTFVSGYQLSLTKEDPAEDISLSVPGPLMFLDNPGAGTFDYELTAQASTSVREAQVNDCRMVAFEL